MMKAIDKSQIRIRAEEARAAALWTLPVVQGQHTVALERKPEPVEEAVVEEEIVAQKLTLSELEKIREDAYQEGLLQGREEGLAKGLEEGRQTGHAEGLARAQAEVDARLQLLQAALTQLDTPLRHIDQQVEQLVAELTLEFAQAVVANELNTSPETVLKAVQDCIAQLPQHAGDVLIQVHPEDLEVVEPLVAVNERWQILDNADIQRGGCKVEASNTVIDHTMEQRLAAATSQLRQAFYQPADGQTDAGAEPESTDE